MEKVILINKEDRQIGEEEKLKAHLEGKLHRAFSILIFNKKGEILLQKRAKEKPFGGLWSNTCCSHQRPGEKLIESAKRRLKEEMGIKTEIFEVFSFHYTARDKDYIENEIDHVFFGIYEKDPKINKREAEDFKWMKMEKLRKDIRRNPQNYTFWFKKILEYAQKYRELLE